MPDTLLYLNIALPVPLRRTYDYSVQPSAISNSDEELIGRRVKVMFGPRPLIGIITGSSQQTTLDPAKVKPIRELLDSAPVIPAELIALCSWAASYYHHPIGEALSAAMPPKLRQGDDTPLTKYLRHTSGGLGLPADAFKRAKKQQTLHALLLEHQEISVDELKAQGLSSSIVKALKEKGIIEEFEKENSSPPKKPDETSSTVTLLNEQPKTLNEEQEQAVEAITYHNFGCYLLDGTTGSGKTEVYLHLIERVLRSQRQALVLIPEINLGPQTIARFKQRFNVPVAELHSNVNEGKRLSNWKKALSGEAKIIIGTRLSSLAAVKDLGIIIVDEEHDPSYKQQDGFKYSARDISIYRAQQHQIPIVLGSATPSLESLANAKSEKYTHLRMTNRATGARPPVFTTIDIKGQGLRGGLSSTALDTIQSTLLKGEQILVFINRRGYASGLQCHTCGWCAECGACDGHMTVHMKANHLRCHNCDRRRGLPKTCPNCGSADLKSQGVGTEQTEQVLQQAFPKYPVVRVDRDSTRRKDGFAKQMEIPNSGQPCIMVGTQMLAKGHHLAKLSLVIIIDADQGFLSPDFRSSERMAQLITQVAGRAGRELTSGHVLLQSHQPNHPSLITLISQGYFAFASLLLSERSAARLPPYWFMAEFKAESKRGENATNFLRAAKDICQKHLAGAPQSQLIGPMPDFIERIDERFRYSLTIKCQQRSRLHHMLKTALVEIDQHPLSKRTRWSLNL